MPNQSHTSRTVKGASEPKKSLIITYYNRRPNNSSPRHKARLIINLDSGNATLDFMEQGTDETLAFQYCKKLAFYEQGTVIKKLPSQKRDRYVFQFREPDQDPSQAKPRWLDYSQCKPEEFILEVGNERWRTAEEKQKEDEELRVQEKLQLANSTTALQAYTPQNRIRKLSL